MSRSEHTPPWSGPLCMCLLSSLLARSSRWVSEHKESLDHLERKRAASKDGAQPCADTGTAKERAEQTGHTGHSFLGTMRSSWGPAMTYKEQVDRTRVLSCSENLRRISQNQKPLGWLHVTGVPVR